MTDKQQPFKMPEPAMRVQALYDEEAVYFTADQVRAAYEQGLERAAMLCDDKFEVRSAGGFAREASTARNLAEEIRNLKDEK